MRLLLGFSESATIIIIIILMIISSASCMDTLYQEGLSILTCVTFSVLDV
jgi:hypothetical protein